MAAFPKHLLFIFVLSFLPKVYGQQDSELESSGAEVELKKSQVRPRQPVRGSESASSAESKTQELQVDNLSDLSKLQPFQDVSVLQKRFMPKTNRVQFFGGLATVANDPWFLGIGFNGRVGYGFSENWGVELSGYYLGNSAKETTKSLSENLTVGTKSLISTKSYFGLDVVWTPIYGKMSLLQSDIVPFDMYFAAGGGSSMISSESLASTQAGTFHLGLGQIFSISRSLGFRWDLSVNSFTNPSGGNINNVLLNLGLSFYIPEVRSR